MTSSSYYWLAVGIFEAIGDIGSPDLAGLSRFLGLNLKVSNEGLALLSFEGVIEMNVLKEWRHHRVLHNPRLTLFRTGHRDVAYQLSGS